MYLAQYFYCQIFQLEDLTDHMKDHQLASSNDHFTTLVNESGLYVTPNAR